MDKLVNLTIVFFLRPKYKNNNLICRLRTKPNGNATFPVMRIDPAIWVNRGKASAGEPDDSEKGRMLREILDNIRYKLMIIASRMFRPDAMKIRNEYLGMNDSGETMRNIGLLEAFKYYIAQNHGILSPGTLTNMSRVHKKIQQWVTEDKQAEDIALITLSNGLIDELDKFFQKTLFYSTRKRYIKYMITIVNYILKNLSPEEYYLPKYNVIERFNIMPTERDRDGLREESLKYLDEISLNRLESTKFEGMVEYHRQIFLFQRYTGISYRDLREFEPSKHIVVDMSGRKMIEIRREKTVKTTLRSCSIPVFPQTERLLEYFMDWNKTNSVPLHYRSRKKFFVPIDINNYNGYLKRIAAALSIPRFTCHQGRHTFAVKMLEMGFSMEAVSKMLGHSSIAFTQQIYGKITTKKVSIEWNNLFNQSLNGTNTINLSNTGTDREVT